MTRLPEARVREIKEHAYTIAEHEDDLAEFSVREVYAMASEVLEYREMLRPKGKPGCTSCGGAGWYQWTAGGKTTSEDCHCRVSPSGEARDG